ncbi:MAG: CBS domain-containing protein [Anaerolineae bacterium]
MSVENQHYNNLTTEEQDRIEQYITTYNAIKEELARQTGKPETVSLNELINEHGRERRRWLVKDGAELIELAQMRNLLVHERNEPYEYLFLPTSMALERIQRIYGHLIQPPRVRSYLPKRQVSTVAPDTHLAQVLELIAQRNYSQFPIYQGEIYRGILTTNGIARWLSDNIGDESRMRCLTDCTVQDILAREEPVEIDFTDGEQPVELVIERFATRSALVCLLITTTGDSGGRLQQIITRYDVADLLRQLDEV